MDRLHKFTAFGRKIIGVGRNYRDHAAELGNVIPDKPLLFLKPPSSYILEGQKIEIPLGCHVLHHEIELGVVIGSKCSRVPEHQATQHIGGYVLALDMTARDFQDEAKKKSAPWSLAKGFDTSCPVSRFLSQDEVKNPSSERLWCTVNGVMKQEGTTKDMIFPIQKLISYISDYFTLEEGDLILTGTPAGVGPVQSGDIIEGGLGDIIKFKFSVISRT